MSDTCGTCGHQTDVDCTCETDSRWWHAYGQVRDDLGGCWQLVVIGPATADAKAAREMATPAWGEYLASFDHHPTDAEKDAITPEAYRDEHKPVRA